MNADILNIDKFVEVERLREITTSNMFTKSSSEPDPEGLVSYEIFGDPSSSKRKTTFAYIDLGGTFINPLAYEVLVYLKRTMIQDVVDGNGEFFIRNGEIVKVTQKDLPDPKDDVGAGTVWLKNHFNEIIFKNKSGSEIVADRINFIKTCTLDEIFITKWLVLPAFYRDVDVYSSKKNDINIMYQFIISQASMLKSSKGMFNDDYIVTDAHKNIQAKINEMYRYFVTFIAGTKAFMQSYVLGKGTDYSARMVISTPKINTESPDDMEVDFGHSGRRADGRAPHDNPRRTDQRAGRRYADGHGGFVRRYRRTGRAERGFASRNVCVRLRLAAPRRVSAHERRHAKND